MIANILTTFRLFMVLPIIYFVSEDYIVKAIFFLFIALITDFLDGYIARSFERETKFGSLMDPIVDKVLYASLLVVFIEKGFISSIAPIIIVLREIIISGLRGVHSSLGMTLSSEYHGKVKTVFQDISMFAILIFRDSIISSIIIYLTAAVTVFSGYIYFGKMIKGINLRRDDGTNIK